LQKQLWNYNAIWTYPAFFLQTQLGFRYLWTALHGFRLGTHNPCSRAVNTGVQHGCHFGHPWTRAFDTGRCW